MQSFLTGVLARLRDLVTRDQGQGNPPARPVVRPLPLGRPSVRVVPAGGEARDNRGLDQRR